MYIIGLTGYKRSGKDTVFGIIKDFLKPHEVVKVAFADALKVEVAQAIGQTVQFIDNNKDNFRLILQGWGTDYRRKLSGQNYWIERWLGKVNSLPNSTYVVVCTDVRFVNEAETIKAVGGLILRVTRDINTDPHESEREIDDINFNALIPNVGTLADLHEHVTKLLKHYGISNTKCTDARV